MPKRPSPGKPQPTPLWSWDIYLAASKAKWIGSVEAAGDRPVQGAGDEANRNAAPVTTLGGQR
jgi:hypothetical protein